jgi:hypothetical protein
MVSEIAPGKVPGLLWRATCRRLRHLTSSGILRNRALPGAGLSPQD